MRVDVKGEPVPGGGNDVRRVPAGRTSLATGTGETLLRLRGTSKTFCALDDRRDQPERPGHPESEG